MTLTDSPVVGAAGSAVDRVWNALDAGGFKPESIRGDKFMALCPVHGDTHRSLSVKFDRRREAVLLNCFTCHADYRDVAGAIGLSATDLFDAPLPEKDAPRPAKGKPKFEPAHRVPRRITGLVDVDELAGAKWEQVTTYPYADAAGTVVEEVIREQAVVDGTVHKRFRQRFRSAAGRWVTKKPTGFTPVLYQHADVLRAIATDQPVWIVEGEKDADNAAARGLVATTNAQGSGSFPRELADVFTGATVNVVADRDSAGYKRAAQLHHMLGEVGATVTLYRPAVDVDKGDLTDHFEAGLGVEDLEEISVGNAVLLQLIADTVKGIEAIAVCSAEIRAHQVLVAAGEDPAQHDEDIAAWAKEALLRYRRVAANVGEVVTATGATDPLSRTVMQEAENLVDQAARTAQEAYDLTGVRVPTSITERLKPADRRVQFGDSRESEAGDPPAFTGNTFIPGDDDTPNRGREFTVRKGQTVEIKWERDGDGTRRRFNRVFEGWGDILSVAFEDNGQESEITRATHEMTVRFSRWVRDEEGNPVYEENGSNKIESQVVTWDEEQLQRGTWADALPWVGMLENTSRRGRELAWDALHNARPAPYARERVYTTTGWREGEEGSYFVHADGAITAQGAMPLRTRMVGGIEHLRVAAPTTEAKALRAAWEGSTVPLREKLPARAMAPVLGLVWRAPFAPVPHVCYLNGAAGSGKSTLARLGMHYFAPGLVQQEGSPKTILSATAAGGSQSGIGLMRVVRSADYMPVLADDFVDIDAKKAEARLENLVRALFDGGGHVAGKARGGVTAQGRINASVIATGQIGITGSALQRLFTIALNPGEIPDSTATFMQLEEKTHREERALLGAALLQWLAAHRDTIQAEYFDPDSTSPLSLRALTLAWTRRLRDVPHNDGARGRMITAAVVSVHGIALMLRMLIENKALTRDEANEFYAWAEAGIDEGIRLQDPGSGDVALLTMELLREALASQAAHISLTDGEAPDNAEQLGWSRRGKQPNDVLVPSGPKVGTIKVHSDGTERLYLFPMVTFEVIKKVAAGAGMGFSDTTTSIGSSFAGAPHFWITPEFTNRDSSTQHTVRPIQGGPPMKVWDLPLSALFGEHGSDDDTDPGTDSPDPSLFDGPVNFGALLDDTAAEDAPPAPEPLLEIPETAASPLTSDPQPAERPSTQPSPAATASAPAKRAAIAPGSGFRGVVGVLDEHGVWLPDGQCVPLPFPIRHIGDAAKVIANLGLGYRHPGAWKSEDGQLLVTDAAARQLGLPVDQLTSHEGRERTEELYKLTVDHPFLTDAIAEGYEIGGAQVALNPMTRVWMPGNDRLRGRFALMAALQDDFTALCAGDADSATIARRLQRYAEMIGKPYAVSAAVTGIDLMLDLAPSKEKRLERFTPHTPVGPAEISTLEADINWQRKPVGEELEHTYVHAFDRGGSYLAGVSGQHYGIGEPRYLPEGSRIEFKSTTPGYWRVVLPERREWLHPNPIDPFNRDGEIAGMKSWLTTATLTIAQELGYELEIVEAYVWDNHGRILDSWAERIAEARAALDTADPDDQAVRELVKPTYTRGLGRMASFEHMKGRPGFAPERYHLIQARSRANIIRRIVQIGNETGRWPVAVKQDTILYTSNEIDPEKAWPGRPRDFGRGLGQYKPEGFAFLNEHLQFLTGEGRYDGKDHLDLEVF